MKSIVNYEQIIKTIKRITAKKHYPLLETLAEKIFSKLCRLIGLELIDQNHFTSPTLNKELNEDLSVLNKKSIGIRPRGLQVRN